MLKKKHAVMMEYVIIAVLVAAAVVVAVIMFGKTISKEMNVATEAMVNPSSAQNLQKTARSSTAENAKAAKEHVNTMHGMDDASAKQ
jgi:Flp pilus assembly pilin Flp